MSSQAAKSSNAWTTRRAQAWRKLRGLVLGRQSLGEFANQRVQADAVLAEFLDEPDVVQPFQGPSQRGRCPGLCGVRHSREQTERARRDGRGFGELPRDAEEEPGRLIRLLQGVPLGLQSGRDGGLMNRLEVDDSARFATSVSRVGRQPSSWSRLR